MTSLASALSTVDPDGGLAASALGALLTFVTSTLGISLFSLVVATVALHMGLRWLRTKVNEDRNSCDW
jgi:hypothetical protein